MWATTDCVIFGQTWAQQGCGLLNLLDILDTFAVPVFGSAVHAWIIAYPSKARAELGCNLTGVSVTGVHAAGSLPHP